MSAQCAVCAGACAEHVRRLARRTRRSHDARPTHAVHARSARADSARRFCGRSDDTDRTLVVLSGSFHCPRWDDSCLVMTLVCTKRLVRAGVVTKIDRPVLAAPNRKIFFMPRKQLSECEERSRSARGSATAMKMGGTGTRRQRSQDFLQRVTHTKKRKLSGFGPLFS